MADTVQAPEQDAAPRRRGRTASVRWLISAAVVLAAVAAATWYWYAGPEVHGGGFGVGGPVHVGEAFNVGIPVWTDGSAVRLDRLDLVGPADDIHLEWAGLAPGSPLLGSSRGDPERDGFLLESVVGREMAGTQSDPRYLVVSITPTRTGMYQFDGVRLSYRSGLRSRTETLPISICVVAIEPTTAIAGQVDRCKL